MKQIIIFLTVSAFITIISIAWQNAPEKQSTPEELKELERLERSAAMHNIGFKANDFAVKSFEYSEPSLMVKADSVLAILKLKFPDEEFYFQMRESNETYKSLLKSKLARRKLESQN
jgi:hypothetical protein